MFFICRNRSFKTTNLIENASRFAENISIFGKKQNEVIEILVDDDGPGIPENAGITIELIKKVKGLFPIFGVCLGHQAINNAFGGKLLRLSPPIHGKLSKVEHNQQGVFKNINDKEFEVTRYHSLAADPKFFPKELIITASSKDGVIMGLMHKKYQNHGVQFHPESINTKVGMKIIKNFVKI